MKNFLKKYWKNRESVVMYEMFQIMEAGPIIPADMKWDSFCYLVRKKVTTCKLLGKTDENLSGKDRRNQA